MSAIPAQRTYTAEDYLALERNSSAAKCEFINGQIFAMTGANRKHNLINVNIAANLSTQLKGRPFETYVSDMRVKAAEANSYLYPDVSVVCGKPEFEDAHVDILLNPTVLVENSRLTEKFPACGNICWLRKTHLASNIMCGKGSPGY
jgi:Uma2 family endonuclease